MNKQLKVFILISLILLFTTLFPLTFGIIMTPKISSIWSQFGGKIPAISHLILNIFEFIIKYVILLIPIFIIIIAIIAFGLSFKFKTYSKSKIIIIVILYSIISLIISIAFIAITVYVPIFSITSLL